MLNSCYILQIHTLPSKEGCTSFQANPEFLKNNTLQGIVERSMQLYQCYSGANKFQYFYSGSMCIHNDPLPSDPGVFSTVHS